MLVIGGREESSESQTDQILSIRANGEVRVAGTLPHPLSDAAAVALGGRVIVAGGRDAEGHVRSEILSIAAHP
jgi:N-acetylneuraminic acid mutarotase